MSQWLTDVKGDTGVADVSDCRFNTKRRKVSLREQTRDSVVTYGEIRVLFPGALNSKFTNSLEFLRPSTNEAISTYRVLDQYGEVLDKETGVETQDEEALSLYRNMVCCKLPPSAVCLPCSYQG
jgi:hypothetical protein